MNLMDVYMGSRDISMSKLESFATSDGHTNFVGVLTTSGREMLVVTKETPVLSEDEIGAIGLLDGWISGLEKVIIDGRNLIDRNMMYIGDTCCNIEHSRGKVECQASLEDCQVHVAYYLGEVFNGIDININYVMGDE